MSTDVVNGIAYWLRRLGGAVTGVVAQLGYVARFLVAVLWHTPAAFRRIHLTLREIYFSGVLSLVIILMSGLFVGMVLSLQGYETLKRYGADEQLGILVALALVRELGPVLAGLLFASRAGSAITAEIGLMKTTEQLAAMEMMRWTRSRESLPRDSGVASSRCRCSPHSSRRSASSAVTSLA